jgi:Phage protein Gp138 N-terminal domain
MTTGINSGYTQNIAPVREPNLKDLLDLYKKQTLLNLNCHHLGTIQSFNSTNQTVSVTINYTKTFFQFQAETQTYESINVNYPIIAECPLIVHGGGLARITFPVAQGDQCLLLFNDRDIDNWFNGSLTSPNNTPRLHSFTDCIALIGPNNMNTIITDYDTTRALITNGTVMNGINPVTNKLTLTNGTSLNTLLQNLCTQIENLCTQLAELTVTAVTPAAPMPGNVSGIPVNASAITTIGNNISSVASDIAMLIE